MKLLEIITSLRSAGAQRLVVELSNEFNNRNNVEVTILQLYPFDDEDTLRDFVNPGIKVETLNKPMGFSIKCFWDMYRYIKIGNYDVVHTHMGATMYLLLTVLLFKRPFYCATIHSEARREAGSVFRFWINRFMYKRKLCQPVTISENSNESFKDYYHLNAPIIYNGISSKYTKLPLNKHDESGEICFVHIARTHKIKNQEMLYRCINRLAKEGWNVKLYHYGRFEDGDVSEKLKSLTSDAINMEGETTNPQEVLEKADALCMSSLMEGMPMTIIESFSVGCPVISTPVGGCVNMIEDGYNGILSKSCSENDYYEALVRFLTMEKEKKTKMKENAFSSFADYNIKNTADSYLELFTKKR